MSGWAYTQSAPLHQQTVGGCRCTGATTHRIPNSHTRPGGRILYTVQEGDTLWRIAAISGLTLEELRGRNNLSSDDVIVPGQILLLDLVVGPAQAATQVPGPATPILENVTPLPTPGLETGNICVLLFDDINGDAYARKKRQPSPGERSVSATVLARFHGPPKPKSARSPVILPVSTLS